MYEASNGVIYNQDKQGRCRVDNNGWYEYWTIDELEAALQEERELAVIFDKVGDYLLGWKNGKNEKTW